VNVERNKDMSRFVCVCSGVK